MVSLRSGSTRCRPVPRRWSAECRQGRGRAGYPAGGSGWGDGRRETATGRLSGRGGHPDFASFAPPEGGLSQAIRLLPSNREWVQLTLVTIGVGAILIWPGGDGPMWLWTVALGGLVFQKSLKMLRTA